MVVSFTRGLNHGSAAHLSGNRPEKFLCLGGVRRPSSGPSDHQSGGGGRLPHREDHLPCGVALPESLQDGGKLPVHVRCLFDECANIGQIPQLEKLVATIRSREISACLVLQTRSQLKAIYKDNADTIVGNMDSQIFLGGSEPTTLKELSEALGKETIDSFNTSDTRGNSPSYGTSFQKLGHELMSRDELAVLDGGKCILQLRGVRPFLSEKYDLTQHPNYKLTADYDPQNTFDIEKYLHPKIKIHPTMRLLWWMLILSRLSDWTDGFYFYQAGEVHR